MATSFHLSLPCINLVETKMFYVDNIGASLGRYSQNWLDINLFGHQLTFTNAGAFNLSAPNYKFEGKVLGAFHFGVILDIESFNNIYEKLSAKDLKLSTKLTFLKEKQGEHLSFFVKDPNNYQLEFKSFKNNDEIFKL
ncbi:VOC family protein [Seonamhaeicola maritimus]|uniref:VOC family protein n=1 Tax=Seonamhaeicola maritimus TaxID=2591822 RepID=UPI002493F936|nr:bleomycin resistance protein [Seonamhaeicola maritimus]